MTFDRVAVTSTATVGKLSRSVKSHFDNIMKVGIGSFVASDLGQADSEKPTIGLARFMWELHRLGMSQSELDTLCRSNPACILGIA